MSFSNYDPKTVSIGCETYDRSTVTEIRVPEGVKTIERNSFRDCQNLKTIILPLTLTSIGSCAFSNCSSLININIPPSVTSIGYDVFANCAILKSLSSNSHQSIEQYLRSRYDKLMLRYSVLMSIERLTIAENNNPNLPTKAQRRRLAIENPTLVEGQFNGLLAFEMITAHELWREIVKFL